MMNIIQQKEISMEIRILKRRALAIALIVICLAITAAGTLAFYTAEERAHNVITTGGVEIEVHEWTNEDKTEPFPEDGVDDVTPGLSVTKIAEVENTGASAAWIRVLVETKVTAAIMGNTDFDNDKTITLQMNAAGAEPAEKTMTAATVSFAPEEIPKMKGPAIGL